MNKLFYCHECMNKNHSCIRGKKEKGIEMLPQNIRAFVAKPREDSRFNRFLGKVK